MTCLPVDEVSQSDVTGCFRPKPSLQHDVAGSEWQPLTLWWSVYNPRLVFLQAETLSSRLCPLIITTAIILCKNNNNNYNNNITPDIRNARPPFGQNERRSFRELCIYLLKAYGPVNRTWSPQSFSFREHSGSIKYRCKDRKVRNKTKEERTDPIEVACLTTSHGGSGQ